MLIGVGFSPRRWLRMPFLGEAAVGAAAVACALLWFAPLSYPYSSVLLVLAVIVVGVVPSPRWLLL